MIFIILQLLRNILIINNLKRTFEVILSKIFGRIFLILLGVYKLDYKYKKQKDNRSPNIIFSSQSSIIDWMVLMYNYSPKFLWIVKSDDNKDVKLVYNYKDIFIELSYLDVFIFGCGLKFLSTKTKRFTEFNVEKYVQTPGHIPLVIFPEVII